MALLWLIIGSAMVVVPFYLFDTPMDPWPSVIAGAIGGTIFLVIFFFAIMQKTPFALRTKIISTSLLIIVLGASAVTWKTMYDMCHYQRSTLGKIRTIIGEGILHSYTEAAMLPPFRAYHAGNQRKPMSIGKLFLAMNKDCIHDGSYKFYGDQYQVSMVNEISDTSVTLILIDTVARGYNAGFKNLNGQTGRLQAKAILTEKGVRHEREN